MFLLTNKKLKQNFYRIVCQKGKCERKTMQNVIKRFCSASASPLRSTLCIVGPNASKVVRKLIPDVNVPQVISEGPQAQKENLQARKIKDTELCRMTVDDIHSSLKTYQEASEKMANIVKERELATQEYKELPYDVTFDKMKAIKILYKEQQKKLWEAEENAFVPYLKLPNLLDLSVPKEDTEIFNNEMSEGNATNIDSDEVVTNELSNLFLKGNIALEELELLRKAQHFLADSDFEIIAPPDIVKNHILEGFDPKAFEDPSPYFNLAKSSDFGHVSSGLGAHLAGSASTLAMLTYFVKNILQNPSVLPLKYYSIGRKYWPMESQAPRLANSEQSSAAGLLALNSSTEQLDSTFDEIIQDLKRFYDDVGISYRLVSMSAEKLNLAESLRIELQMWSSSKNDFIKVAELSKHSEYLSKRLALKYNESSELCNLHIISGTFVDVYKVLSCKYKMS